jgi:hypothetical protein
MKRIFFMLILFVLPGCASSTVTSPEYCHIWKLDEVYEEPIYDLKQWADDNFADQPNEKRGYSNLKMFELDIDHDDMPETFVTSLHLHGSGGGPFLVFKKRNNAYFYIGSLGGRQHTMRVLPLGADHLPRIMTFWCYSASSGTASVWKNDGQRFILVSSEVICSGDSGTEQGRERFEELFGK